MNGMELLLAGIVGSTAYGLAGPTSDVDRLGVFAAPTIALHGLHQPRESIVTTLPDQTWHEARKYCQLAMTSNPTATELMWLPDDLYEIRTELGARLIDIRSAFLSAKRVREAYFNYARQQFRKIESRSTGPVDHEARRRTAKHARHLARLLHQGRRLYATGLLSIRLDDPGYFLDLGERVAAGQLDRARALLAEAERDFDEIRSPLPDRPDEGTIERWLLDVRAAYLPARLR